MKKYLTISGILFILLISELSGCIDILETPKIEFIQEEEWLVVSYIDKSNLTWNNINITISSNKYSDIGFHYSPEISSLKPYGNGKSCPNNWGVIVEDNGIFFQITDAIVTLYWIPTNISLGNWNFT
jgi:hypothetical protein